MIQLDMGMSSRGVWLWRGKLPDAQYEPVSVLSLRLSAASTTSTVASQAAAEFRQIVGPHSNYGLLGAEFVPERTQELTIEVALSDADVPGEESKRWNRPGSSRWTGEYIGLPQECGAAVLEGVRDASDAAQLGGGTLRFDRAAYHYVDSNASTYARLARIVVRLLLPDAVAMGEGELADIVREVMRR